MKKVTSKLLKELDACEEGYDYWVANCEGLPTDEQIMNLHNSGHNDWANWLLVRVMTHKQRIAYSIFAAEQVIDNYEKEYPGDDRPRKAIEASKAVLKRNTEKNRSAARSAAWSARSAAWSAWSAAWSAAESAAWSAESSMKLKILKYGISLIKN